MSDPIVIVSAARTPMGSLQGDFASFAPMTWAAWQLPLRWPAQVLHRMQ